MVILRQLKWFWSKIWKYQLNVRYVAQNLIHITNTKHFCKNTNQGSYKYESGCATNRSIVSWPWLTASDRGRDSCLLDGIHLVYTQTIHEVAQILIKFCTNMFKILCKYKSGRSRKRCVVGSWRYKPISHKKLFLKFTSSWAHNLYLF